MSTLETCLGDIHATILQQHAEIRARFRGLDAGATPASSALAAVYLRVSLLRLAVLLELHLQYEERELGPRLRVLDAWGAAREAALHAEHAGQRKRLAHLCFLAESETVADLDLASEVSRLVVSLLEEMAREERELDELDELDRLESGGPFAQMTG